MVADYRRLQARESPRPEGLDDCGFQGQWQRYPPGSAPGSLRSVAPGPVHGGPPSRSTAAVPGDEQPRREPVRTGFANLCFGIGSRAALRSVVSH